MRRFFHDVLNPNIALGKRTRDEELISQLPFHPPSCVALQNEDSFEDAIVITALACIPFCCHADLLIMNRNELLRVASTFNEKLPNVLRIDTDDRPDAFIRNSIELLVGIRRKSAPSTPTKTKPPTMFHSPEVLLNLGTPTGAKTIRITSTSPLAARNTRDDSRSIICPPTLSVLREEEEENRMVVDEDSTSFEATPQAKRVKYQSRPAPSTTVQTPPRYRRAIGRSQSQRTAKMLASGSPSSRRMFRSRSHRTPDRHYSSGGAGFGSNVTLTRGRFGVEAREHQQQLNPDSDTRFSTAFQPTPIESSFWTSTPKNEVHFEISTRQMVFDQTNDSFSSTNATNGSHFPALATLKPTPNTHVTSDFPGERGYPVDATPQPGWYRVDQNSTLGVSQGIRDLTMKSADSRSSNSGSDMSISSD